MGKRAFMSRRKIRLKPTTWPFFIIASRRSATSSMVPLKALEGLGEEARPLFRDALALLACRPVGGGRGFASRPIKADYVQPGSRLWLGLNQCGMKGVVVRGGAGASPTSSVGAKGSG